MRNLGQFFGHIAQGVMSDPASRPGAAPNTPSSQTPQQQSQQPPAAPPVDLSATGVVRHEIIERVQDTPGGPVKIRRTIIEEEQVEVPGQSAPHVSHVSPPAPPTPPAPASPRSPHTSSGA